jgi:hypothetical protein
MDLEHYMRFNIIIKKDLSFQVLTKEFHLEHKIRKLKDIKMINIFHGVTYQFNMMDNFLTDSRINLGLIFTKMKINM